MKGTQYDIARHRYDEHSRTRTTRAIQVTHQVFRTHHRTRVHDIQRPDPLLLENLGLAHYYHQKRDQESSEESRRQAAHAHRLRASYDNYRVLFLYRLLQPGNLLSKKSVHAATIHFVRDPSV